MSCNKEISSCTAPESGVSNVHVSGQFLSSSSDALRHILRTYKFSKLYMPAYISPEMKETALQECREVLFYTVTPELKPAGFFPKTSAILYPNYFGVCGKTVKTLAARHPNLIVDNSQSFYAAPAGLGCFYDTSLFFGLPDGGIAVSRKGNDIVYPDELPQEETDPNEISSEEAEADIVNCDAADTPSTNSEAEADIVNCDAADTPSTNSEAEDTDDSTEVDTVTLPPPVPILSMSASTRSMLEEIDHDSVKKSRLRNFRFLAKHLDPEKEWEITPEDAPMAYPYFTEDPAVRQLFANSKFNIPVCWEGTTGYAEKLTSSILPLPVGSEFDINDMKVIVEKILGREVEIEETDWLDWSTEEEEETLAEPAPEASAEEKKSESAENSASGESAENSASGESAENSASGESAENSASETANQEESSQENAVTEPEQTPEMLRNLTLRRYRRMRLLPSAKRFSKDDVKKFIERRRELMPLLRENLDWLQEQQKIHEGKEYMLTVLLVTYNHLRTLSTALESILQQETSYPYIIKIIDDCSNDGTAQVCLEYAKLYPDKILYCPEVLNSGAINITAHIRKIKTPYYTLIDGDDRWCCPTKIQRALDFLETHPEYSAFTHDTRFRNLKKNSSQSYTHGILHVDNPPEKVEYENYFYTHITARVHRNNINWEKEYPNVRLRDIYLFYLSLDRGPFYYCDEIMSEYIFSGQGAFSSLSFIETHYSYNMRFYMINSYTKFRHDKVLRARTKSRALDLAVLFLGKRLGWMLYTKYRKYRLLWDFFNKHIKKLDFIEYKHHSYSRCEQLIRDEIWEDRFQQ